MLGTKLVRPPLPALASLVLRVVQVHKDRMVISHSIIDVFACVSSVQLRKLFGAQSRIDLALSAIPRQKRFNEEACEAVQGLHHSQKWPKEV